MAEFVPERLPVFRRVFAPASRASGGWLGAAPWVDATLLVFLVILFQSSVVIRPGIRLELPAAPFRDGIRADALVVTIPQEGMYFFQDERMSLDGLQVALARAARSGTPPGLILEADRRISHGTLMAVYQLAQAAGFREIVLATRLEDAR
ncbi:MAG: biopolymer transporter ExbD [Kiritimatiellae bacterium]|nr:biopolymer transporter ExbD [Kiritimatiellia bacterium]MDW8458080.1 biopolymer transporter ExbD [Verrucomicrobiota bacterium]